MANSLPIFASTAFASLTGLQIVQSKSGLSTDNDVDPRLVGKWNGECFESPGVGTFGGFYNLTKENLIGEIQEILKQLYHEVENCGILLTLPSNHLSRFYPQLQAEALVQLGAKLLFHETNHVISIKEWSTASLSSGNQKKLRQCRENQLNFRQLGLGEIDELYEILRKNRENIGAKVSMTLDQVRKSFSTFPNSYFAFGVYSGELMIAGAICLESALENLYVYMWGDLAEFRKISPIVFLCEALIDFAAHRDFEFLDLGTSSINGIIMPGVSRFKENLGAIGHEKYSLKIIPKI